jgi:adenine/guanine phosphoribosyltransferase-like PRPP-binding protein
MTHGAPSPYTIVTPSTYNLFETFQFGSVDLILPALKIDDDTVIYVLNIMGGNPDYIKIFAEELLYGFDNKNMYDAMPVDGFVSAEGKSIPLVYEMAKQLEVPYIILRKSHKSYMGDKVLSVKLKSITTSNMQELYLDNKDLKWIVGKRLVFVDDVISSGATLIACDHLVNLVGGRIVGCLAMALEGDYTPRIPTYSLTRLPVKKLNKRE